MTYPGGVESVHFTSGDNSDNSDNSELIGVLYPAVGDGARPTAVLLHGIPGSEKNVDIAYRLREMGWHSLLFSFRGTWGSGGDYDITTQPDDTLAAINYLIDSPAAWQVDPTRIALVGYSLGSRAALIAAHRDSRVGAVVSLSGIADFDELMFSQEALTSTLPFLHNATVAKINQQWMRLGGEENSIAIVGKLTQPTLIVHGTEDEIVPYWMGTALHEASGKRAEFCSIEGADHTFTQQRKQLVETVTNWLEMWAKSLSSP
ncbi:MAG: alpha/beta fold hydrolase [Chloroflexota bacterium]